MNKVRILLADDHKLIRDGLASLLREEPDMEVVGQAENGRRAVEMARELLPDIILMDIGMPDLNGIEATRQIVSQAPGSRVVGLSMHSDPRFVTEMLKAGASGYLLKESPFEEVKLAIKSVIQKGTYLPPDLTNVVVENYVRNPNRNQTSAFAVLTNREREVLQLMVEGKTSKEISAKLFISMKTVDTHRQNIMDKLDIHNVAELTKYAIREGLTSL